MDRSFDELGVYFKEILSLSFLLLLLILLLRHVASAGTHPEAIE